MYIMYTINILPLSSVFVNQKFFVWPRQTHLTLPREWRKKSHDKVRKYNQTYWQRNRKCGMVTPFPKIPDAVKSISRIRNRETRKLQ